MNSRFGGGNKIEPRLVDVDCPATGEILVKCSCGCSRINATLAILWSNVNAGVTRRCCIIAPMTLPSVEARGADLDVNTFELDLKLSNGLKALL